MPLSPYVSEHPPVPRVRLEAFAHRKAWQLGPLRAGWRPESQSRAPASQVLRRKPNKLPRRFESLEKRTPFKCISELRSTPRRGALQPPSPAALVLRSKRPTLQVKQMLPELSSCKSEGKVTGKYIPSEEEAALQKTLCRNRAPEGGEQPSDSGGQSQASQQPVRDRFLSEANLLCVLVRVHAGWHCLFIDGTSRLRW